MKVTGISRLATIAVAATLAGCASQQIDSDSTVTPKAALVTQVPMPIGRGANWTYCTDTECPEPTPKTEFRRVAFKQDPKPVATVEPVQLQPMQIIESDVLFPFNSAIMKASGLGKLRTFAREIPQYSLVTVVGHTDRLGDDSYNLDLSKKRAESVRQALATLSQDFKFSVEGVGESQPVTKPGECPDTLSTTALRNCLQPDRRVTLQVR